MSHAVKGSPGELMQHQPPDWVWDQAMEALTAAGVTEVFGLPDDDMHAMGAIERQGLRLHSVVRQTTAVHMASGHAAAYGRVGACVVGRGPAVAAAVPGLLEAWESQRPLVVLAPGTSEQRRGTGALQDAPTIDMVRPVTKRAHRVTDSELVGYAVADALATAQQAPAGPVYLEISDPEPWTTAEKDRCPAPVVDLNALVEALASARRPLLLLGSGAGSVPSEELVGLAESLEAGVIVTASGRGCFPEHHRAFLGVSGLYLMPEAAAVAAEADVVLALGSRLEETALAGMPTDHGTRWLQVNLTGEHLVAQLPGLCAVEDAAELVARRPPTSAGPDWVEAVAGARAACFQALQRDAGSRAAQVLAHLTDALPEGTLTVHENGLHDIWSYSFPHLQLPAGAQAVVLSEQTTLGGGVAAAAGIAAAGRNLVTCLTGDAALSTLLPELHSVLDRPGPLLYVVFDDGGMGWLDREARGAGVERRFIGGERLSDRIDAEHLIVADDALTLGRDVVHAVDRALAHRPTLLWVPVTQEDIAPQLRTAEAAV